MDIELIIKIAVIGIAVAVLNMVLTRAGREDIALLVSITGLIIVLIMVIDITNTLFKSVRSIFELY